MDEIRNEVKDALNQFKIDLAKSKQEIINEVRLSKTEIEEVVTAILPKDHEKQHIDIQRFLDHAPDPKVHGDHHDFTESVRTKIEHTIVAIFKGLGGIILIALLIGLYTWMKHQAGTL